MERVAKPNLQAIILVALLAAVVTLLLASGLAPLTRFWADFGTAAFLLTLPLALIAGLRRLRKRRISTRLATGVLLMLLVFQVIPPFLDLDPFLGLARGVESQRDPTACEAVGNNWTTCDNAFSSDNVYAYANATSAGAGQLPSAKDTITSDTTTSTTYEDVDGLSASLTIDDQSDILLLAAIQASGSTTAEAGYRLVFDGTNYLQSLRRVARDGPSIPVNILITDLVPNKAAGTYTFKLQHKVASGTLTTSNAIIVAVSLHNGNGVVPANSAYVASDTVGNSWSDIPGLTADITLSKTSHIWALMVFHGYHSSGNKAGLFAINIDATRMEENGRNFNWVNQYEAISVVTRTDSEKTAGTYTVKGEWKGAGGTTLTGEDFKLVVIAAEADSGNVGIDIQKGVVASDTTTATALEDITGLGVTAVLDNPSHVLAVMTLATDVSDSGTSAYTTISIDGTDYDVMETFHYNALRDRYTGAIVRTDTSLSSGSKTVNGRWYTDSGNTLTGNGIVLTSIVLGDDAIPSASPGKNDTAWKDFGFAPDASDTVTSVEVGVEWFRNNTAPILNVTVSWDGGSTWATNQTATNKSSDDDTVEWLNFTSATSWNASKLNDANFRVRVGTNASGARLDYVTVRVNFSLGVTGRYYLHDTATSGISPAGKFMNTTLGSGGATMIFDTAGQKAYWYTDTNLTTGIEAGGYTLNMYFDELPLPGLNAKFDTFTALSGTGSQPVTGVGFQPKAVIFWFSDLTATGSGGNARGGMGFSDGTNEGANTVGWNDASSATSGLVSNTKAIWLIDGGGTTLMAADLTSLDADGFTLEWTVAGGSRLIHYLALGGISLTNVKVGSSTILSAESPEVVTGLGFEPSALLILGKIGDLFDSATGHETFSFGVGASTTSRHSSSGRERGSSDNGYSGYRDNETFVPADDSATPEMEWDLQSFDSDGFTLVKDAGTEDGRIVWMAMSGVNIEQGILIQPTSAGEQSITGLAFEPSAVLFDGGDKATTSEYESGPEITLGGATSSTQRGSLWFGETVGGASDTDFQTTKVIRSLTAGTPTLNAEADFVSFNADGFTINWTTADATARKVGWVALGPASANVQITAAVHHTKADGTDPQEIVNSTTVTIDRNTANPFAFSIGSGAKQTFTSERRLRALINVTSVYAGGSFVLAYDSIADRSSLDIPALSSNTLPVISNFRLENATAASRVGEQLDVDQEYFFLFNVTDENGWTDIGGDGNVSLRLWYDGNVSTTQRDSTACEAVGNNWTNCNDAFSSNNLYAYANNTGGGGSGLNIALIVNDSAALDPDTDVPLRDHLETTLGHSVTLKNDFDSSYDPTTFDAVVISESVDSYLNAWLKDEVVGILTVEGRNWDELEMGTAGDSLGGGDTDIDITDNTHYITQVFPTGVLTVTSVTTNLGSMSGWANDVNKLAHYDSGPTFAKLLVVEKGGVLQGGTNTSADRRVFFGAQYFANLNEDGRTLFNRSLDWVAYITAGGGVSIAFDASTSSTSSSSPNQWSHPIGGGSNRLLVVSCGVEDTTILSVTYNGVTLDGPAVTRLLGNQYNAIWWMNETKLPAAGSYQVSVTSVGAPADINCIATSVTGAAQAVPEATASSDDGETGAGSINTDITTLTDGAWVFDLVGSGQAITFTRDSPQVERGDVTGGSSGAASSTEEVASAGLVNLGWTADASSNRLVHTLAAWAPAAAAEGGNDTAWMNYGFALGSATISTVEVGVEWFRNNTAPILNVTVSWDGGTTWATNQTATNKFADDDTVEFLEFTAATAWTPAKLNDANLRVRIGTNASGARLDYVTVRVGSTSELTFSEQTTGANYRIELKYVDTVDPSTASLDEWTVTEGSATYNASASSLTAITTGYEFKLALKLGFQVKQANDPTDSTPGGYNDLNSWNGELVASDGSLTATLQTASTGEHMEFGVYMYTFVNISANWAVTVAAGASGPTNTVTVYYRSNDDFRITIWFTTHLVQGGDTIDISNVTILAVADSNDNITSDTAFVGLGESNATYIFGSETWWFTHATDADENTVMVQFSVSIPGGSPTGTYVADLTIKVVQRPS